MFIGQKEMRSNQNFARKFRRIRELKQELSSIDLQIKREEEILKKEMKEWKHR